MSAHPDLPRCAENDRKTNSSSRIWSQMHAPWATWRKLGGILCEHCTIRMERLSLGLTTAMSGSLTLKGGR